MNIKKTLFAAMLALCTVVLAGCEGDKKKGDPGPDPKDNEFLYKKKIYKVTAGKQTMCGDHYEKGTNNIDLYLWDENSDFSLSFEAFVAPENEELVAGTYDYRLGGLQEYRKNTFRNSKIVITEGVQSSYFTDGFFTVNFDEDDPDICVVSVSCMDVNENWIKGSFVGTLEYFVEHYDR